MDIEKVSEIAFKITNNAMSESNFNPKVMMYVVMGLLHGCINLQRVALSKECLSEKQNNELISMIKEYLESINKKFVEGE